MDLFQKYVVASEYGDLEHPGAIVETASLSCVEVPSVSYMHNIPLRLLQNPCPKLSGVQMDAIIFAGSAHGHILESKERQGFVIGDGTGVGKGRMLAGIILDNWLAGRQKSLYVSTSRMLYDDLKRDVNALINDTEIAIPTFQLPKEFSDIIHSKGILFCTYSSLCTTKKVKSDVEYFSRRKQVANWLGKSFEGPIIFDEAHKAKGYHLKKGETEAVSTITGKCVVELQRKFPKARVVYVSATVATRPQELQYMDRIGVWGESTGFESSGAFVEAVSTRGVSGCELVALELKQRGLFLSRHLSLEGISVKLTSLSASDPFKELFNECTTLWLLMFGMLKKLKVRSSLFWAAHQKFFKSLCVSAKLPGTLKLIRECLTSECSVVVGVQSTGQAAYEGFRVSPFHDTLEACSPTRWYLEYFLTKYLLIAPQALGLEEVAKVTNTKDRIRLGSDSMKPNKIRKLNEETSSSSEAENSGSSDSESDVNDESVDGDDDNDGDECHSSQLEKIISIFNKIKNKLPLNPIDVIKLEFGKDVAEISGRTNIQVLVECTDGKIRAKEVFRTSALNKLEQLKFQKGDCHIVIISEAGSTGLSLQSNVDFKNKQTRVHIILEAPWSATTVAQQMGRTNRSNQQNKPRYHIVMSDIPGEQRFAVSLGAKMKNMGALCKGDQRSTNSEIWEQYSVHPEIAKKSITELLRCIIGLDSIVTLFNCHNDSTRQRYLKMLKTLGVITRNKKGGLRPNLRYAVIEKFLNRVLGMPINYQTAILEWLEITISKVKCKEDIEGKRTIQDLQEIVEGDIKFKTTKQYRLPNKIKASLHFFSVRNILEWDTLQKNKIDGFFQKKCRLSGQTQIIAVAREFSKVKKGAFTFKIWKVYSQNWTIKNSNYINKKGYTKIKNDAAEQLWKKNVKFFEERGTCVSKFKTGECQPPCNHKAPYVHVGILAGGCLNLYNSIMLQLRGRKISLASYKSDTIKAIGVFIPCDCLVGIRNLLLSVGQNKEW